MKVVSLNTWKCEHKYTQRLKLMSEQLALVKPDILFLQEVFSNGHEFNTARYIANRLTMHFRYLGGRKKHRRLDNASTLSESGLAILSHYLPDMEGCLSLPSVPEDGDRWAQWVRITVDNSQIILINTHLSHLEHRDDLRTLQVEAILDVSNKLPAHDVLILGGDMNAELEEGAMEFLSSANWCSHWKGQLSSNTLNIGSEKSIDHLFIAPFSKAHWTSNRVCLELADSDGLYPSDHKAVSAVLKLTP